MWIPNDPTETAPMTTGHRSVTILPDSTVVLLHPGEVSFLAARWPCSGFDPDFHDSPFRFEFDKSGNLIDMTIPNEDRLDGSFVLVLSSEAGRLAKEALA